MNAISIFTVLIYLCLVILADVPSAILFAGLDAFKALIQQGAGVSQTIPLMVKMICVAAFGHTALFAIKGLAVKFPATSAITGLMMFSIIITAQPMIQLFLRVIPTRDALGFGLGWSKSPALNDPLLIPAFVVFILSAIAVNAILAKYS